MNPRTQPAWCQPSRSTGAGGAMMWAMFSWRTSDPLLPITSRPASIVPEHVLPFMATIYPACNGYCHDADVTKQKTGFMHMKISSVHFSGLPCHHIWTHYDTFVVWWSGRFTAADKSGQLYIMTMATWSRISMESLKHIVESMPTKTWGCFQSKGKKPTAKHSFYL